MVSICSNCMRSMQRRRASGVAVLAGALSKPCVASCRLRACCRLSVGAVAISRYLSRLDAAQALQQTGSRPVEPADVARVQTRLDVLGQHLAQLHAPLIKAIDAPERATDKHAMFLQRDQRTQTARGQIVQQ